MSDELGIVKVLEGEILGPESAFVIRRSQLRNDWQPIVESAAGLAVVDDDSRRAAVEHGRLLQAAGKGIEELYKPVKQQIDQVKKQVLEAEKADLGAVTGAKTQLGAKVQAWTAAEERIHAQRMREAAEAARREEVERRLAEAIAAEQAGEKAEAEQILDAPAMPAPVMVQAAAPKPTGQVQRTTWAAQVDDLKALVAAVAAGQVPLKAVMANEAFLNRQAADFQEGLNYPGVSVHSKTSTHFRM